MKRAMIQFLLFLGFSAFLFAEEPLYKKYEPSFSTHQPENIEWSIFYSFDTPDTTRTRLLMIGDSICNGYSGTVRECLNGEMTMAYWASSKCMTSPEYFRSLDMVLSFSEPDVITFNNGLHSQGADIVEWEADYRSAVKFIRARCPNAKLYLVFSTPEANKELEAKTVVLNEIVRQVAQEENLPIIDLFSLPYPEDCWSDGVHFRSEAILIQAKKITETVLNK